MKSRFLVLYVLFLSFSSFANETVLFVAEPV